MGRALRVEADGGSRGNPGVAGYGALVRDAATGDLLVELAEPLGQASNNVAEYRGMIAGLEAARRIDPAAEVEVALDSKLVVEQMSGRWKIKHADMRTLALQARDVVAQIGDAGGSVDFVWIPRADNADADALSNRAMDGESVADWHDAADEPDEARAPGALAPQEPGEPTRVVLVLGDPAHPGHLRELVGDDATSHDWTGTSDVLAAWREVVAAGGTAEVTTDADGVRAVLGEVLGIPAARRDRLVVAEGSLTGIEARPGGEALVAFVGRV